ncbi:unnamed protein product [Symbiodinium sp. CCMP2592]|nr:unnamed protein product [Symbiodinium sp. CCMP2592]
MVRSYDDKADGDHDCQYDGNMMTIMMVSLQHAHHHDAGSGGDSEFLRAIVGSRKAPLENVDWDVLGNGSNMSPLDDGHPLRRWCRAVNLIGLEGQMHTCRNWMRVATRQCQNMEWDDPFADREELEWLGPTRHRQVMIGPSPCRFCKVSRDSYARLDRDPTMTWCMHESDNHGDGGSLHVECRNSDDFSLMP